MVRYVQRTCLKCRYPLKGLQWSANDAAEIEAAPPRVCCPECGTWQDVVALRRLPPLKQSFMWCSAVPVALTGVAVLGYAVDASIGLLLLACAAFTALTSPLVAIAVFEERYRLHPTRGRLLLGMLVCGWAADGLLLLLAVYACFTLLN